MKQEELFVKSRSLEIRNRKANSPKFPSTRYQGSKQKLSSWILAELQKLSFDSALDLFGGTGVVSYHLKAAGKTVAYNDYLQWNAIQAKALIENSNTKVENHELDRLFFAISGNAGDGIVSRNFSGIYFTDEENAWIDSAVAEIQKISNPYKRAIVFFGLFQACIAKRPYNLFHRKNLYVRTAEVQRSFGNKVTWDTPFETHMRKNISEANAAIFDNGKSNLVTCLDASKVKNNFDLVYMDPPYTTDKGVSVDYRDFYHFLEGLVSYEDWQGLIDFDSKHRRLKPLKNRFNDKKTISNALAETFEQFKKSTLVLSYRSDGIPSESELVALMKNFKKTVRVLRAENYQYVLSTRKCDEVLIIGE